MTLAEATPEQPVTIRHVGGDRSFRRRLMELGFLPGTLVELIRVAPLGDPLVFRLRGCSLSIRRREAARVRVEASIVEAAVVEGTSLPLARAARTAGGSST